MVLEQQLSGGSGSVGGVQEACQQGKRDSRDSVDLYVVRCCKCDKWRNIPTKEEFETIRENLTEDPWFCGRNPDRSCEEPEDIQYDTSRIWVMDKPDIPKPPPETERLVIMRNDMSKMDTYYVMPNGKRARCSNDVDKFLEDNPEYKATLSASSFSFKTPKVVKETVSGSSMWMAEKAAREKFMELNMADSSTSSSSNN